VLNEIATRDNLHIVERYKESGSAHEVGRPNFNKMLDRLERGDANAILVWHQDRLSRNARDGATLIYYMDQGYIKEIRTKNGVYANNADNKSYLGHEFVDSKKYSDHLSEMVIRGLASKVNERREWPGVAKPGYLNVSDPIMRTSGIAKDPIRFPMLQQIFDMIRTGAFTPLQALDHLNKEMGYKTRRSKHYGDKPMSRPTFYRILSDPFYYGLIEHTQGTVMGTHEPMMSKIQFDELQVRLGKVGKPHQSVHGFPYKEVIRCGECGGAITAQEKYQIRCRSCKTKYHKKANDPMTHCKECRKAFESPEDYQFLHYVYYGCTKKKTPGCTQGHVRMEKIEKEIDKELSKFEIRPEFRDWAIKYLNEVSTQETDTHKVVIANLQSNYSDIDTKINNLMNMYISPLNAKREMLSDEEFKEKKTELMNEKATLMDRINQADLDKNKWVELTEKTFDFACYARYWFAKGDAKAKTEILDTLGNNLTLKDGKIWINRNKQFFLIENGMEEINEIVEKLEPKKKIGLKDNLLSLEPISYKWRGTIYEVITYLEEELSIHRKFGYYS